MGDTSSNSNSDSNSDSNSSSSSEPDDHQRDPSFKCSVKNIAPSDIKKRLRDGVSKSSSLGSFPVGSSTKPKVRSTSTRPKVKTLSRIYRAKFQKPKAKMVTPPRVRSPPPGGNLGGAGGAQGGPGVLEEVRQALLTMAGAMHQVGTTARQNNTNFLSDIPYFGIPPESDRKKSIIPLGEAGRFLDIVDTVTNNDDFTVAGKIAVLKSKLLGPAQDHWSDYRGGDNWNAAKAHLLSLFPEVQSYASVQTKIANMKREKNEQISCYANRVHKAYNTLQRLHPAGGILGYPNTVKQYESILKLLDILPEQDKKWMKINDPITNDFF